MGLECGRRNTKTTLAEKGLAKRSRGRLSRTWDNNIKLSIRKAVCWWIELVEDRLHWRALALPALKFGILLPQR
jgi:hypothetical protein